MPHFWRKAPATQANINILLTFQRKPVRVIRNNLYDGYYRPILIKLNILLVTQHYKFTMITWYKNTVRHNNTIYDDNKGLSKANRAYCTPSYHLFNVPFRRTNIGKLGMSHKLPSPQYNLPEQSVYIVSGNKETTKECLLEPAAFLLFGYCDMNSGWVCRIHCVYTFR